MTDQATQLRACAKWHERQAHRNPKSAKRHYGIADTLRTKANAVVRMFSGSVNPPRAEVLAGYSKQFLQGA
jgi:hypothetical protein